MSAVEEPKTIRCPQSKARRDRNKDAGVCINAGPRSKVEHGPPASDSGRCAYCVEVYKKSKDNGARGDLTGPMIRALEMLHRTACHTATSTYGDSTISGWVAKRLVDLGFAKYVAGWQTGNRNSLTKVQITDAGKTALDVAVQGSR